MLEAQRGVNLLERLEEGRRAEWKAAHDRELDEIAAESFLANWEHFFQPLPLRATSCKESSARKSGL